MASQQQKHHGAVGGGGWGGSSLKQLSLPSLKKAYLKKQNRTGLYRSWKQRYFVLELGILKYFEKVSHVNLPPYGEGLKGTCDLSKVHAIDKSESSTFRILINYSNDEDDDLLIEFETHKEHNDWLQAINYHCRYAQTADKSIFTSNNINDKQQSDDAKSGQKPQNNNSSISSLFASVDEESKSMGTSGKWILPEPNFVIKCLHEISREKIFINFCHHEAVPLTNIIKGSAKWPFMVSGEPRDVFEEKESDGGDTPSSSSSSKVRVIDVVVHPEISRIIAKDSLAKEECILKVLRHITKYRNEQVNEQFKLPKILRRYKGEFLEIFVDEKVKEAVSGQLVLTRTATITSDEQVSSRRVVVVGGGGLERTNSRNDSADGSIKERYMSGRFSSISDEQIIANSSTEQQNDQQINEQTVTKASILKTVKSIPYEIVAANGVMAKIRPDKNSSGRVISCGQKVNIVARYSPPNKNPPDWWPRDSQWSPPLVTPPFAAVLHERGALRGLEALCNNANENMVWLMTSDALFIPEKLQGFAGGNSHSRLLKPICQTSPKEMRILKASLVEEKLQGFSFFSMFRKKEATYTTSFIISIEYDGNGFIQICRSINDVVKLRMDILKVASAQLKARLTEMSPRMLYMKTLEDGSEECLDDAEAMMKLNENCEYFLNTIITILYPVKPNVNIAKRNASPQFLAQNNAMMRFMTPNETDILLMDINLVAGQV